MGWDDDEPTFSDRIMQYDEERRYQNAENRRYDAQWASSSSSGGNAAAGGGGGILLIGGLIAAAYIFEKYYYYIISIGGIVAVCVIAGFIIKLITGRWDIIGFITLGGIGAIISVFAFGPLNIFYFFETNWVSLVTCLGILLVTIIIGAIIRKKANKPALATLFCILAAIVLIGGVIYIGPVSNDGNLTQLRQKINFPIKSSPAPTHGGK